MSTDEPPGGPLLARLLFLGAALVVVLGTAPWTARIGSRLVPEIREEPVEVDSAAMARDTRRLEAAVDRLRPTGPYLVVSTTDNRFRLMAGSDTLRAGVCSTGSYVNLEAGDGRSWLFVTPRGRFRVLDKRVNPVWSKPDWAFIEAGLPVPPAGDATRYERGVLGRYALSLGDGYLVHGTPYQRLLGQPVTHGCVRLGDLDLEAVYVAMRAGSPVFIY